MGPRPIYFPSSATFGESTCQPPPPIPSPVFLGCGVREGEFVFRSSLEGRNGEYNNGEKEKTEETERKKRERERLVQFPSFLSPFFLFELLMKRGEEEEEG